MSVLTAAPAGSFPARSARSVLAGSARAGSVRAASVRAGSEGAAAVPRDARSGRTATAAAGTSGGTRVYLTRRGRAVVLVTVLPLALVAILMVAAAMAGSFAAPAKAGDTAAISAPVTTYVVAPGDSLWSIALEVAPNEDPRATVSALVAMNGIHDPAVLRVGAELVVPLTP